MALGDLQFTPVVAANGTATAIITPGGRQRTWIVQQVSVELSAAPLGATCEIRKNGFLVTFLVATGDAAGGDPPVRLLGSDVMTVKWSGCTPGQVGRVFVIYEEETP